MLYDKIKIGDYMKNRLDIKGMIILILIFIIFYFIASSLLYKYKPNNEINEELETDNFKFGIVEPISFTGIAIKQIDNTIVELTQEQSQEIYNYLVKNEYLTSKGKATSKYHQDKHMC